MKPSDKVKSAGLKSLAELSQISQISTATLRNWFKSKPFVFNSVLFYAVKLKESGILLDLDKG